MLVTTLNSSIHLMDRQDGSELQRYTGHTNTSYRIHSALGHGEASVLAGDETGKIWKWDLTDSKHIMATEQAYEKSVMWVHQCPNADKGEHFVTAGSNGEVKIWQG